MLTIQAIHTSLITITVMFTNLKIIMTMNTPPESVDFIIHTWDLAIIMVFTQTIIGTPMTHITGA